MLRDEKAVQTQFSIQMHQSFRQYRQSRCTTAAQIVAIVFAFLLLIATPSNAQISLDVTSYSQNFDGFAGTAATIPSGWSASFASTAVYGGTGSGASGTGGVWGYGGGSDFSFGALRSGTTGNITLGVGLTNGTGLVMESLSLSWNYEQWRYANTSGFDASGTGALAGNATLNGKDFTGSSSGTNGIVSTTAVSTFALSALSIADAAAFGVNWLTTDVTGADNGISVDDFSIRINQLATAGTDRTVTSVNYDSGVTIRNGAATNSVLTANLSSNQTFAGALQDGAGGTLGFTKSGAGTLILTGTNTNTGDTNVNDGVLKVDGSTTSNTFVNSGGTLAGAGTIFAAVTNNGGIVAPGDSPGTLIVNSFTQNSGTLLIDIAGLSMFSVLDVNGLATLGGILNPMLDGYTPNDGDQFAFLLYGSRSGTFASILGTPFAGGHWEITYNDNPGVGNGPGGGGMAILMAQMNAAPGVPDQGSTLALLGLSLLGLVICHRQFAQKRA